MTDEDQARYQEAFTHVMTARELDSQLNWQRAGFTSAILALWVVAAGTAYGIEPPVYRWWVITALAAAGTLIAFVWFLLNILGRRWNAWWNAQASYLEGKAFGNDVRVWRSSVGEWKLVLDEKRRPVMVKDAPADGETDNEDNTGCPKQVPIGKNAKRAYPKGGIGTTMSVLAGGVTLPFAV